MDSPREGSPPPRSNVVSRAARAVVALLLLCELVARKMAPPPSMPPGDPFLVAHPEYGFVLAESRHHQYDVTRRGFKGLREWPAPPTPGELRILVVGDSNACRLGEPDWPGMLEDELTSGTRRRRVFVANVSVPGWSSLNAASAAAQEIPLFEPDVLIVSIGTNDPYPAALRDSATHGRPDAPNLAVLHAERHSRLAALLLFQTKWRRTAPEGRVPRLLPGESGENVRAILAAAPHARRIVILPHYPIEHFGGHIDREQVAAHREAILAAAMSLAATTLDFSPEFDGPGRERYLEGDDTIHVNDEGSRLIAERLTELLNEAGGAAGPSESRP